MGALRLTYNQREEALEKSSLFVVGALEVNGASDKNRVRTYRYGFNGMEKDDAISGAGNSMTTLFRQYDSRLGRWLSLDPKPNASVSWYAAFANNPIWFIDPLGDTITDPNGNEQNEGDGYTQSEDGLTLSGEGLDTKVWDPNLDVGTDQSGGYVDYFDFVPEVKMNLTLVEYPEVKDEGVSVSSGAMMIVRANPASAIVGGSIIVYSLGKMIADEIGTSGSTNYPGPLTWDRPVDYVPKPAPKQDMSNAPKSAGPAIEAILLYKLYKTYKKTNPDPIQTMPADNTYYYRPAPNPIITIKR